MLPENAPHLVFAKYSAALPPTTDPDVSKRTIEKLVVAVELRAEKGRIGSTDRESGAVRPRNPVNKELRVGSIYDWRVVDAIRRPLIVVCNPDLISVGAGVKPGTPEFPCEMNSWTFPSYTNLAKSVTVKSSPQSGTRKLLPNETQSPVPSSVSTPPAAEASPTGVPFTSPAWSSTLPLNV
jgi:hypothetical protein